MKYYFLLLGLSVAAAGLTLYSPPAYAQQRIITAPTTDKVFIVADNGTKRWLQSPRILQSYGLSFAQVQTVSETVLAGIPDTKAIRLNDNPGIYLLTEEGIKRGLGSIAALHAANLTLSDVVPVNQTQFEKYATGGFIHSPEDLPITPTTQANLITSQNTTRVYGVAPNGTKRWLRTPSVLHSYGFSFGQIRTVSPSEISNTPNTRAIRMANQPHVYRLNADWTKQHITSPQILFDLGLSFSDVIEVNQTEFESYPTGPKIASAQQNEKDYRTYTSQELGFRIKYLEDMSTNRTQIDTVRFQLFGPTQRRNTEFTDGISLTISRQPLQNRSMQQYLQDEVIEEPVVDGVVVPIHGATINGIGGFSTTTRSLGTITHIVIPSVEGAVFHISYVNPDPDNRGYQRIVDHMLSTFTRL